MTLATAAAEPASSRVDRPGAPRQRGRFVFGLALLAVLIVVPTAAAVVSYDRMVRSNADREMQNTADLADVFLREQNAGLAALMDSVADDAGLATELQPSGSPAPGVVDQVLRTLSGAGTDISTVFVLDAEDRVVGDLPDRVPDGYDLSKQSWIPEISDSATYSVSSVFRSPLSGGDFTTITVPVRDAAGTLLGHVAIARKITGYQRYVDSYGEGRGVRLSVLDGSGQLVADSEGAAPEGLTRATRLARGATVLSGSGQIVAASAVDSGDSGYGWRVVAQESKGKAMRPAVFFRAVAIGTAAVLLLGAMLVFAQRRRASRAARQANRSLSENQRQMRDLANSSPGVLLRLDPHGVVDFCSVAGEQLLGISAEDLAGRELAPFLVAESEPDTAARLETLVRTGEQQVFLARTRGPGGTRRIVECNFRSRAEDVHEIWGSLQDVTDRLSARDQVEQLFQLSADFMAVADFSGRLVLTNPVWSASLGIGPEQLLGQRFEEVFHGSDEADRRRVADQLARLVSEPGVATFENRYVRDDSARILLWTAASDPDRRLIYAVGRDITAQKELQNALAETRDQALEASRLKSEFVATMSHEIRTPMNGVIGLTDLLLGTPLTETQRRYVEGVRTAGDALLTVINDILDFSRIEAGRLLLDKVDFRLEDVVDDVVTLVRQNASAKGLELTVEYEPGVPFALNGDPGRLRQVLLNLTHNAVKFTEHGGVSIAVIPGRPRSDGQVPVNFAVSDTGIGIEPGRLDLLFEPFRQADEGTSRAYGGTGLGLSISRRLADLMSGTIRATSSPGRGATFVAELVFAPAADWGRSVRGRDARGLAVLIVDDNEVNRLVMTTQLTRWGMRPVAAASAAEAMDLLTNRSAPAGGYDLAVVDMHMPDRDGIGLIAEIRREPVLSGLPIILVTSGEEIDDPTADEHGISARLTKPVRQSDLFGALTRVGVPTVEAEPAVADRPEIQPLVAEIPPPETGEPEPAQPGGFHLLLVEDNDINQTVALGILSQLGYQVDVAGHGEQALTMTEQHSYDAILMDCQMPVMDGYRATVELRKRPGTRTVPIIAMTAATFAADRQRCFDSGMDDFIAKPVRATTLQATLNRWLRMGQDEPPAGRAERTQPMEQHFSAVRDRIAAIRDSEHAVVSPISPVASAASVGVLEAARPTVPAQPGPDRQTVVQESPAGATPAGSGREGPAIADTDERIAELLGDGTEFEVELVRDIISSFLSRTVDLFQRLSLAVTADDAEAAYLHAHSLAGAGLNLGTVRVVEIARQIEAESKAGRPGGCGQFLIDLEVALDQARVGLRDIAANLPDPTP